MLKNIIAAKKLARELSDVMDAAMRRNESDFSLTTLDNIQADLHTLLVRITLLEKQTRAIVRNMKE